MLSEAVSSKTMLSETTSLTCPVCQCPNIRSDRCPNCETDLSLIWQLRSLPLVKPDRFWQGVGLGGSFGLLLGLAIATLLRLKG
jgi:hypothetical protein